MENHDTFNPSNILELDNWILVGSALFKMASFFWPVMIVAIIFIYLGERNEVKRQRSKRNS